jgi:SNF2 family DNA or RNA helicase
MEKQQVAQIRVQKKNASLRALAGRSHSAENPTKQRWVATLLQQHAKRRNTPITDEGVAQNPPPAVIPTPSTPIFRSREAWVERFERDPSEFLAAQPLVSLWPVQEGIHEFLVQRASDADGVGCKGALICESFGSGKTLALLNHILRTLQQRVRDGGRRFNGEPCLIIVPPGLFLQWIDEREKYIPPGALNVLCLAVDDDVKATEAVLGADTEYIRRYIDVVITTYSAIEYAARRNENRGLFSIRWHLVVAEEATVIINSNTSNFAACSKLEAGRRLFISATPARNNLEELDNALAFIGVPGKPTPEQRIALLKKVMLRSSFSRIEAMRGQPGGRQTIREHIEWCHFPPGSEEGQLYDRLHQWYMASSSCVSQRLGSFGYLRSACTTPVMLIEPAQRRLLPANRRPSTKIARLLHFLQEKVPADEKVLIFSEWVVALKELHYHLHRAGVSCGLIIGETPLSVRSAIQHQFNQEAEPRVLLLNFHVAATGLNLQRGNWVFFLESWWTPAVEKQAIGRVDREDQRRPIHVVSFCMFGTVENHVLQRQREKNENIGSVLS